MAYDYCINLVADDLVADDGRLGQQECQPISPDWPTSNWQANEVARSSHTFRVAPFLEPGAYNVMMTLRNAATGEADGDAVKLGMVQVNALNRVFALPEVHYKVAARFGESVQLYGYDLEVKDAGAALILYWRADERLDRSYKVFVHAVDAATGEMLAQYDSAPRNWSYPTNWWEAGEVVSDPIELAFADTVGGDVLLLVGLYDEQTGERLILTSAPPGTAGSGDVIMITLP